MTRWPIIIWLEGMVTPSLNEVMRLNHHAYTRMRNTWREALAITMDASRDADKRLLLVAAEEKTPMRVDFQIFHGKLYDHDNAVGGIKMVLDSLKVCSTGLGWLADDSHEMCKLTVKQIKSKRWGTELSIQPKGE
jgi:hypothetical protein